jgi:hypothetical protein
MATVKELRESIVLISKPIDIREDLDSLIAASHAEGVAEGVEQERQREIQVTCGVCGHTWKGVLAPTKEKGYYAVGDNGESGESHA